MFKGSFLNRNHALLAGAFLALLLGLAAVSQASASYSHCRGDPVVWLSNGTKLNLTAAADVKPERVDAIIYTLHTPKGLQLTKQALNKGILGKKEHVLVYDDGEPGQYTVDTLVSVKDDSPAVTVTNFAIDLTNGTKTQGEGKGYGNQHVITVFPAP